MTKIITNESFNGIEGFREFLADIERQVNRMPIDPDPDIHGLAAELRILNDKQEGNDTLNDWLRIGYIGKLLPVEFGRRRGWHLAKTPFTPHRLGRIKVPVAYDAYAAHEDDYWLPRNYAYYYRDNNHQPVGIVCHLRWNGNMEGLDEFCDEFNLNWQMPDDFPNWGYAPIRGKLGSDYPEKLIVYTRRETK